MVIYYWERGMHEGLTYKMAAIVEINQSLGKAVVWGSE